MDLFDVSTPVWKQYLPSIQNLNGGKSLPQINIWDIPYTIPQLGYLTHSDFRYYGKFPPPVAGQLLEQYAPKSEDGYVLDNFCGSGTTLVEAKLRSIPAIGVDVNPIAVLASNVKVRHIDLNGLRREANALLTHADNVSVSPPSDEYVDKWFTCQARQELSQILAGLHNVDDGPLKDFLIIAFFAIIRRVSRAYDGEVRPHINPSKKERSPKKAYRKKLKEMISDHFDFQENTDGNVKCYAAQSDNRALEHLSENGRCELIVSHPAYLNSFDYTPAYKLENYWAQLLWPEASSLPLRGYVKGELRAYPANEDITSRYYRHLQETYAEAFRIQPKGGYLAVVIGDCTRKGHLEPVVDKTCALIEHLGYKTVEINYRTTHYGLGKYAYSFRADYHGERSEKKDAVVVFEKPS